VAASQTQALQRCVRDPIAEREVQTDESREKCSQVSHPVVADKTAAQEVEFNDGRASTDQQRHPGVAEEPAVGEIQRGDGRALQSQALQRCVRDQSTACDVQQGEIRESSSQARYSFVADTPARDNEVCDGIALCSQDLQCFVRDTPAFHIVPPYSILRPRHDKFGRVPESDGPVERCKASGARGANHVVQPFANPGQAVQQQISSIPAKWFSIRHKEHQHSNQLCGQWGEDAHKSYVIVVGCRRCIYRARLIRYYRTKAERILTFVTQTCVENTKVIFGSHSLDQSY
jgi:hypothetical protein